MRDPREAIARGSSHTDTVPVETGESVGLETVTETVRSCPAASTPAFSAVTLAVSPESEAADLAVVTAESLGSGAADAAVGVAANSAVAAAKAAMTVARRPVARR
ncbi:hypothetical protein GCM10009543_21250 [Leifsonia naganoensis]